MTYSSAATRSRTPHALRVLLVLGHPRRDSLCGALADAYCDGAGDAGVELRRIDLAALSFTRDVTAASPEDQPLEPDLQAARADLAWAEHLVFVYPTWWGTMPALLKSFLDRLVMPGFAFRFYGPGAAEWEGLWPDKSAQLITTMDTPPPVYRWLFHAPGTHAMRNATLGFCGVRPTRALVFGPVRTSDADRRAAWLEKTRRTGFALRSGVRSPAGRAAARIRPWLSALRLQFYPMSWAAYGLGAVAAATGPIDWAAFVWGLLFIALLEAATVFCNERLDLATDRINPNHGPFTGGSRVLVTGAISPPQLRRATGLLLVGALTAAGAALGVAPAPIATALWMGLAVLFTLGYTVGPLRLSYRGLGEVDVAFTHSALVLVLGGLLQGAALFDADLWLLSAPLALAILPSIVLAGVPDHDADAAVGKRTIAVRLGRHGALRLAGAALVAAATLGLVFEGLALVDGAFAGLQWFVLPHAALGLGLLWWRSQTPADRLQRIDGLLVATLTYMLWFVLVPWFNLS
ncbi:NAD(P)H dehydrogenase [Salinisphaera orenii YIM 95161]|uniref:NAD(P)H dehydrogenase n=1 Tax=Salinisphaera orenii YIM 95161 TaxID=1051139 RepID=A0A423PLE4_9GAMM|nr:NAD(P)H-dependent oxidoreductase [Salinisphaera halophila]ROO26399.1 NAD(P)H dehydrogenase [Salinisphaera halophila YIM 95161]